MRLLWKPGSQHTHTHVSWSHDDDTTQYDDGERQREEEKTSDLPLVSSIYGHDIYILLPPI